MKFSCCFWYSGWWGLFCELLTWHHIDMNWKRAVILFSSYPTRPLSTRLCCSYAIFLVVHAKWIHMFYLFLIPGVNEGENMVLRREKEKIAGTLGTCVGRGVYRAIADDHPHTGPIRKESWDPSSLGTSVLFFVFWFFFTINPGPWGKWERGLVTGLSLDSEKINSASIPFPPNLPFVPQFDD